MKAIYSILAWPSMAGICLGILSIPVPALATDGGIWTKAHDCQFYYTTDKNTDGWTFGIEKGTCENKLAQGRMTINIYDAFSRPIEQIYGYFNHGYWTGEKDIQYEILTASKEDKTHKITFMLDKDDATNTLFIGQMTAEQKGDQSYGPYLVCEPARVLAVATTQDIFRDKNVASILIDSAKKYALDICPKEERVMLFGSTRIDPKQDDIIFYADINIPQNTADVLKMPGDTPPQPTGENPKDKAPAAVLPASAEIAVQTMVKTPQNQSPVQRISKEIRPSPDIDNAQNILTLSHILNKPVNGKIVVHMTQINPDNTGTTEQENIRITGKNLKPGWFITAGKMNAEGADRGVFTADILTPCAQEKCVNHGGQHE